jgi:hypothetical protein
LSWKESLAGKNPDFIGRHVTEPVMYLEKLGWSGFEVVFLVFNDMRQALSILTDGTIEIEFFNKRLVLLSLEQVGWQLGVQLT